MSPVTDHRLDHGWNPTLCFLIFKWEIWQWKAEQMLRDSTTDAAVAACLKAEKGGEKNQELIVKASDQCEAKGDRWLTEIERGRCLFASSHAASQRYVWCNLIGTLNGLFGDSLWWNVAPRKVWTYASIKIYGCYLKGHTATKKCSSAFELRVVHNSNVFCVFFKVKYLWWSVSPSWMTFICLQKKVKNRYTTYCVYISDVFGRLMDLKVAL